KLADHRPVGPAEDPDVRPAARAGAGDDVREAVAVDVGRGDEHPATERGRIGEKAADGAGQELERPAVKYFDVRPASRAGGGNDVRNAVAVDVAAGHAHAAAERAVEGIELEGHLPGSRVERTDPGQAIRIGADENETAGRLRSGSAAFT